MTIDEAIKHCLEVAEKNDGEAEVYGLLAKNHNNSYEKLTATRFHADCAECAADHRQLAEWLTELKELKAADAQIKKSQWQPPIMGQGKCSTYCRRCFGTVMRNATGMFEETPFCPHCGADMRNE